MGNYSAIPNEMFYDWVVVERVMEGKDPGRVLSRLERREVAKLALDQPASVHSNGEKNPGLNRVCTILNCNATDGRKLIEEVQTHVVPLRLRKPW